MTVKELIDKLKEMPPNFEVVTIETHIESPVNTVELDEYGRNKVLIY